LWIEFDEWSDGTKYTSATAKLNLKLCWLHYGEFWEHVLYSYGIHDINAQMPSMKKILEQSTKQQKKWFHME